MPNWLYCLLLFNSRTHVIRSREHHLVHDFVTREIPRVGEPISPEFIGRHLAGVSDKALQSVGAYQVEGEGIQLFDKIDGDYFTIVGLPLLPMLRKLRALGEIDG